MDLTPSIGTQKTVEFLLSEMEPGSHVLEIGCGDGAVSRQLAQNGHNVFPIDSNPESVRKARQNGVNAKYLVWPAIINSKFDAVIFSRSLHHMPGPESSIAASLDVIRDDGCLLIEDFAKESMDASTIQWFIRHIRSVCCSDGRLPNELVDLQIYLGGKEPLQVWFEDHDDRIHSFHAMRSYLDKMVDEIVVTDCSYLFRYFGGLPVYRGISDITMQSIVEDEESQCKDGDIRYIGRRLTARIRK